MKNKPIKKNRTCKKCDSKNIQKINIGNTKETLIRCLDCGKNNRGIYGMYSEHKK